MSVPAYVIDEEYVAKLPGLLAECGFSVTEKPSASPLAVMYFCRSESSAQILVRFAADTRLFPGKVIVICQPAAGWPWKLGKQEQMMARLGTMLESHGAVPFRDAV